MSELATCLDGDNLSAVVHAMMSGNVPCAQYLLSAGASPNTVDGMGMTPLHHAVMGGNPEAVTMLLASGADCTVADGDGKTAAEYAEGEMKAEIERAAADGARAVLPMFEDPKTLSEAEKNAVKDAACSGDIGKLEGLLA